MKYHVQKLLAFAGALLVFALPALAELPKSDLTVELRQVEEGSGPGNSVSTESRRPIPAEQRVQVRNGEKASLSVGKSMPMQWVRTVSAKSSTLATTGASASSSGGGVTNAVTWMDAGQSIKLHPRWPGGKQQVVVDVEMQSASVDDRTGSELPDQSRSQVSTTVSVPLGQWVTIATSGSNRQQGVYGSEASSNTKLLLQIRVLAP